MKKVQLISFLLLTFLFCLNTQAFNDKDDIQERLNGGEITGKITENGTNEGIAGVLVMIQSGGFYTDTETDANGLYTLKPLVAGTYTITLYKLNYQQKVIENVNIFENQSKVLDETMLKLSQDLPEVIVSTYTIPLIEVGDTKIGGTITSEDLRKLPTKNIRDAAILTTTGVTQNNNGEIQIRGARVGSNAYYVDGIRVNSLTGIPNIAVDQMQVLTGGIPAKYGDTTGGVVIITTKSFRSQ